MNQSFFLDFNVYLIWIIRRIFFFFTIFWIEDDLNNFFWNTKQLDTIIHKTFLKKRSILLNLLKFPICCFLKFFEKLLCKRDFVIDFKLIFRYFVSNIYRFWFIMFQLHTILNAYKFRTWGIILIFNILIRWIGFKLTYSKNAVK